MNSRPTLQSQKEQTKEKEKLAKQFDRESEENHVSGYITSRAMANINKLRCPLAARSISSNPEYNGSNRCAPSMSLTIAKQRTIGNTLLFKNIHKKSVRASSKS